MIDAIVFDLGGVLIDWNPRYLYRQLFASEAQVEWFLREVCPQSWNHQQDAGRPFAEAIRERQALYPRWAPHIAAYFDRWPEMLGGALQPTVALLNELRRGYRVLALTNWSAETFPHAQARFDFLRWFEGIVVSGELGMAKPQPEIFQHLIRTYGLQPHRTAFIDDVEVNVVAAREQGLHAVRFVSADQVREALRALGVKLGAALAPLPS